MDHERMMILQMPLTLVGLFVFLLIPAPFSAVSASDLVRTSCSHARYPNLCLRTLSTYSGPANTPKDLAQAALTVSLAHARRLSRYLTTHAPSLAVSSKRRHRQRSALRDCAEQIADSVDNLNRSLKELQHLRAPTFQWQMSNAQTWVSAALTDDDTCLDGLSLGYGDRKGRSRSRSHGVIGKIKRKINRLARVTSNALYMINRLGETRQKGIRDDQALASQPSD